jgi:hypothetical protein
MSDVTPPIGEDDLHAYVDGQLQEGRRPAVERHLDENPAAARKVADYQVQREAGPGGDLESGPSAPLSADGCADGCAPNTAVLGSRVYIRMPPSNRPSGDNAEISRGRRHRDEFKIRGRKHAEFLACSFFPAQHPDLRTASGPMQTAIEP